MFIACVTYAKHAEMLPQLLECIKRFDVPWELHFMDTTPATAPELAPYASLRQQTAAMAGVHISEYALPAAPYVVISRAREALRQRFLASDCTRLLFIDDDMGFPPQTLSLLLSHDAPVVSGVYLGHMRFGDRKHLGPVAFINDTADPTRCRPLRIIDVLPQRVFPVVIAGFGCVLLRRDVLEQVAIPEPVGTTEDTPFFLELERRGIPVLLDTRVKCPHYKFPLGDQRNRELDFASYKTVSQRG